MIHNAETLSEISLGNVDSEEDAIQKAKSVFVETKGT